MEWADQLGLESRRLASWTSCKHHPAKCPFEPVPSCCDDTFPHHASCRLRMLLHSGFRLLWNVISGCKERAHSKVFHVITSRENSSAFVYVILPLSQIKLAIVVPHNAWAPSLIVLPSSLVNPIIIKASTFAILFAISKAADEIIQE